MVASDFLRDARIVIVGAGAVGAALSYRLAQAGASVTVVEQRFPGSGTTGSSFAWLNGFNKPPREYHRLNIMSIRDHEDLADELGGDWVHVNGGIHWSPDDNALGTANLQQSLQRLRSWGVRIDTTTPEVVMRELEPDLWIDPEQVSEVYILPREGWLDTVTFAHGSLRAAMTRYGAVFVHGMVTGLNGPSGAVTSVVVDGQRELPADVVINAAGPDAGRIAEMAGVRIPMDRQIGMLLSTAPAPVWLRHTVHAPIAHLRPDGGGRLLLHHEKLDSYAVEGEQPSLEAPFVEDTLERGRSICPGLRDVPAQSLRVGIRPMPIDGVSIVGFEPAVSGLYTVVTHSGITLSARLALLVTEELSGGDTSELEPFRPTRFTTPVR